MEEVLAILGFSLGASLGIGAVRSVSEGSRPILRDVLKAGIRAWDGMANAASAARGEAEQASQQQTAARSRGRRRPEPRKIEIAHE